MRLLGCRGRVFLGDEAWSTSGILMVKKHLFLQRISIALCSHADHCAVLLIQTIDKGLSQQADGRSRGLNKGGMQLRLPSACKCGLACRSGIYKKYKVALG